MRLGSTSLESSAVLTPPLNFECTSANTSEVAANTNNTNNNTTTTTMSSSSSSMTRRNQQESHAAAEEEHHNHHHNNNNNNSRHQVKIEERRVKAAAEPSAIPGVGPSSLDANNDGEAECWICHAGEDTPQNPLVSNICLCRGSVGCVHQMCIDTWVFFQRNGKCPSCGASYNVICVTDCSLPQTLVEQLSFLFWYLFLPLAAKTLGLLTSVALNGFLVPCIIGVAYYHKHFVSDRSGVEWKSTAASNSTTNTTPIVMSPLDEMETSADNNNNNNDNNNNTVWLWFSIMVYGWICVTLWRCTKTGWAQWRNIFADANGATASVSETTSSVGDSEAEDEDANNNNEEEEDEEEDDEDEDEGGMGVEPSTSVGTIHWALDWCLERTGGSRKMFLPRMLELSVLIPFSFLISFPVGKALVLLSAFVGAVFRRYTYPAKRLNDITRRFDEVQERKSSATDVDIALWFLTYLCELVLFSVMMGIVGGIVVHLSLSPYLLAFPVSFSAFMADLSLLQLVAYWMLGSFFSVILLHVETSIIVPLFAPGVELFFVRSVDLNLENDSTYWNFVLAQVFDVDPLRVFFDFLRLCCIEMAVLYLFLSVPLHVVFSLNQMKDGGKGYHNLALPLDCGFPISSSVANPVGGGGDGGEVVVGTWIDESLLMVERKLSGRSVESYFLLFGMYVFYICRAMTYNIFSIIVNPFFMKFIFNGLVVLGIGTSILCMKIFPIRHTQLKILRRVVMFIASYIVHLEHFLFDSERLELLDAWLRGDGESELQLPEVPLSHVFIRREWALPPGREKPAYLRLRVALFSFLFFVTSSTIFWFFPMVIMTLALNFLHYSIPVVCFSVNFSFFLWSPKKYYTAFTEFLLFIIIIAFWVILQPFLLVAALRNISLQLLIQETMEFYHKLKRTVGPYKGEEEDLQQQQQQEHIE